MLLPLTGIEGASSAQHLGIFNWTSDGIAVKHVFGVEFDAFENQEFNGINDNNVGLDVNSLASTASNAGGIWKRKDDKKFIELGKEDQGFERCGVAARILHLHEELESKVSHRDIKGSNVSLDKYMNAKLRFSQNAYC